MDQGYILSVEILNFSAGQFILDKQLARSWLKRGLITLIFNTDTNGLSLFLCVCVCVCCDKNGKHGQNSNCNAVFE